MIQGLRSATLFSLVADPPHPPTLPVEPCGAFDAAQLVGDTLRLPCAVRRISAAGATLVCTDAPPPGTAMALALAHGQSIPGTIHWREGDAAGFVFSTRIDVVGALARVLASQPAERRLMPRVELRQTICVRRGGTVALMKARNISQGGVGVEGAMPLHPGEAVQLTFDGLRPLDGAVAWAQRGQAGIAFAEALAWQTLMPWLRQAQQDAALAAPPGDGPLLIPDPGAIRLDAPARLRAGVHWWSARACAVSARLVELETRATLASGAALWVSLPAISGAPALVIASAPGRILCEFRLPLRPHELAALTVPPPGH